MVTLRKDRVTI